LTGFLSVEVWPSPKSHVQFVGELNERSVNCTVRGARPKLVFILKKAMGGWPGCGGTVGLVVGVGGIVNVGNDGMVGVGGIVIVENTNGDLTQTKDEYVELPPLLKTFRVGLYFPTE